jgi:hypothetical protein
MNPEDPEQRIRDLERGLSQPPEAGVPPPFPAPPGAPPPPPPPYGIGSGSPLGGPYMGGPYDGGFGGSGAPQGFRARGGARMARLLMAVVIPLVGILVWLFVTSNVSHHVHVGVNPFHTGPITVSPGGNLTVGGSHGSKTVACNGGDLTLGGDHMTFTVTGHCRSLEVAGDDNHVTVDSADTIHAYGDDNATTYHSGSPTIDTTPGNTVQQG